MFKEKSMKINIVSSDKRYELLNSIFLDNGYDSNLSTPCSCGECDVLVLSVRNEFTEDELGCILGKISETTTVFCGNLPVVKKYFNGRIVDYSANEAFVQKNAYLTAEGTISYLHSLIKEALCGKNVLVSGYGRIGSTLCRLLKGLGAVVFAYARREESIEQMKNDGIAYLHYTDARKMDVIVNTVPFNLFTEDVMKGLSSKTQLVELASWPYGFSDMSRVNLASGIPGKVLPLSAARAVYDTITSYFPFRRADK